MIWFDLVTPKSVMFFEPIIKEMQKKRDIFITTRGGTEYSETIALLKLYNIEYTSVGDFGGNCIKDKYSASLNRQLSFIELISKQHITKLVSLSSVDACRVAYGLGIAIINFYDIPLSDHKSDFTKALPQARLTIPLATKMFKPFIIPNDIIRRFGLDDSQIYEYNFIDPYIWLYDFKLDKEYTKQLHKEYGINPNKKTIIAREEEYKSSYVNKKFTFLYDSLKEINDKLDINIVIIPRYDYDSCKKDFPFAIVLNKKIKIQHLLAEADLFIGGGGTINSEACFLGTPTISTRSFISHYDKYQIDTNLMHWVSNKKELTDKILELISKRIDTIAKEILGKMSVDIKQLTNQILE
jgi:predicted glycosyltransferase